jgi:hypothetical protein
MFYIGGTGRPNFDGSFGRIVFAPMQITILGTESLGVRGLSCQLEVPILRGEPPSDLCSSFYETALPFT